MKSGPRLCDWATWCGPFVPPTFVFQLHYPLQKILALTLHVQNSESRTEITDHGKGGDCISVEVDTEISAQSTMRKIKLPQLTVW